MLVFRVESTVQFAFYTVHLFSRLDHTSSEPMRTFFILLVLVNLGVFALGQGWFGQPRSEAGRTPFSKVQTPLNAESAKFGPGRLQIQ